MDFKNINNLLCIYINMATSEEISIIKAGDSAADEFIRNVKSQGEEKATKENKDEKIENSDYQSANYEKKQDYHEKVKSFFGIIFSCFFKFISNL